MANSNKPSKTQRTLPSIPWPVWKQAFKNLPERFADNHTLVVAGGVAFYFFLSVFPGIAAIISIYGLFTDPTELQQHMARLASVLPAEAQEVINERLKALISDSDVQLEWQAALTILLSVWVTNVGTRALFRGVNIAYGIEGRRSAGKEIGITIIFTLGGILFYVLALALMIGYPAVAEQLALGGILEELLDWVKYPVFALVLVAALTLVYRYAPVEGDPRFRRMLWGAVLATLLWIVGSFLLSFGIKKIGMAPSYGTLAAVAILMLWFLLSSFVILLGAEINSELEQVKGKRDSDGKKE